MVNGEVAEYLRVGSYMAVDWGFAGQIGGLGFGFVFLVLIILALAMWLVGLVVRKISVGKKDETDVNKKGDQ